MKAFKKLALVFVLLTTCFTFSACSWWNSGTSNSNPSGGNFNGIGSIGEMPGGYDPGAMTSQMPTLKAIAGVYVPESDEISAENKKTRDDIYTGVKSAAANAIVVPAYRAPVEDETSDQTAARIENNKQRTIQLEKQNAVKSAVDKFIADGNVDGTKYGLFASEAQQLVEVLKLVAGTANVDSVPTPYQVTQQEGSAITDAVKNYLTNNVPGRPVEGETGDFAGVLVSPIVEIQVFYVETYQVTSTLEGSTVSITSDVEYLDDHNGYSTRFEDQSDEADRKILPARKWLTFYFAITPGSNGYFYFHQASCIVLHNTEAENAEDLKAALINYTGTITAKSNFTSIDYKTGKADFEYDFDKFQAQTVEEQIAELEQQMKNLGMNFSVDSDTRETMQETYDSQMAQYGDYCQFTVQCFDSSKPVDERAPKFSEVNLDNVVKDTNYAKAIVYVKVIDAESGAVSYGIDSRAENIANTFAINIKTNGAEFVPFRVEGLNVIISQTNKTASDGVN